MYSMTYRILQCPVRVLCKVHGKCLLRREFDDVSNLSLFNKHPVRSTWNEVAEENSLTYRILPRLVRVVCK